MTLAYADILETSRISSKKMFLLTLGFSLILLAACEDSFLDHLGDGDVIAVKIRLENEKAKRLLLQNDVESVMLKMARLERLVGMSEAEHPLAMASHIQSLNEKILSMEQTVNRLHNAWTSGSGSTYVRWGRTTCPGNGTELVYKGYVAGSHYTHTGSAGNYLCLAGEPLWGHFQSGIQDSGALLYGGEYQLTGRTAANFFGKNLLNQDAPCVVCRSPRSSVLMIPGRNLCYGDWNLEYTGYLVGGHYSHQAGSEFICLDIEPETIVGGQRDSNGKLFYFAEARCGSLKCPPYENGRELTCVVCTK